MFSPLNLEKEQKDLSFSEGDKVGLRAMQLESRRYSKPLVVLSKLLTAATCSSTAFIFLFSLHLHLLPSSNIHTFYDQIPTPHAHDTQRWTRELAQPRFRAPFHISEFNGARWDSNYEKLWKPPSNRGFLPCINPTSNYTAPAESLGYLQVYTNGGLNQMRLGICDMVAIARIINATLVIPELDKNSYWQDNSRFSDIFDEEHFINYLANDVKIIKKLPKELVLLPKMVKEFVSWSGIDYYKNEIASLWKDYRVIRASKSDSRLANNKLPPDIQKLRCRACYEALHFSPQIQQMGKLIVERMRSLGPFISLHLRYEMDILAFTGCTHDLSAAEAHELWKIRQKTDTWRVKEIDPTEQRSKGFCPLTPKEVGIFLTALGYPSETPIYIAAGELYGGEIHMSKLRSRYPLLLGKEMLVSVEELKPFVNHASRMAALDYIVSVESDVFLPSYPGNMARAVEGHRRFLGRGRTISPDRKALVRLFDKLDQGKMTEGTALSDKIIDLHISRLGSPRKRRGTISGKKGKERFRSEEAFYLNPLPDCLCQTETHLNATSHMHNRLPKFELLDTDLRL